MATQSFQITEMLARQQALADLEIELTTGRIDAAEFRNRARRLGFQEAVIDESIKNWEQE